MIRTTNRRIGRVRWAAAAVAVITTVSLAACSDDEDTDTAEETTSSAPTSAAPSEDTPVPQVGGGAGLSEQSYVALDQDSLRLRPTDGPIDDDDPSEVLTRGLASSLAWNPYEDSTQFDAVSRAASVWNNTYLADEETRLSTLVAMSSRDWQAWGDEQIRFIPEVTITNETHPPDTGTDFSRVVSIDMISSDGDQVLTLIGQARVHNSEQGWRIDSFEIRDTVLGGQ